MTRRALIPVAHGTAGLSLLELVLGLAIGMVAMLVIASNASLSDQLRREMAAKDALFELETKARETARYMLPNSKAKSKQLTACLDEDGKGCVGQWSDFSLLLKGGMPLTGSYGADGQPCVVGPSCVVKLETSFLGACERPGCDVPHVVYVRIALSVRGDLVRQVIEPVVVKARPVSDENVGCPVSSAGVPTFARGIARGKPDCTEVPAPKPKLTGIKPGTCNQGKQILAGFGKGGEPLCENLIFKKQP